MLLTDTRSLEVYLHVGNRDLSALIPSLWGDKFAGIQ